MATWFEMSKDVPEDPGAAAALGRFWAEVLGTTHVAGSEPGDPGKVDGPPGGVIELCPVPEPKTVKHRIHLDVHTESIERLVGLGATVLEEFPHWTVMADPEGGEFCAFVREQPPAYRLYEVVVDCADPERMAGWWGARFGVTPSHDGTDPWWWLEGVPGMPFDGIVFGAVPEPKSAKNRLHFDVRGEVAEFVDAGATVLDERERWTVLADPEGNEFCVFPPA